MMETQPAVQPVSESENVDHYQLCKKIKTLIAKGDKAKEKSEQFYIAAGLELKRLKAGCSTQRLFLDLVGDIGLGKSRAYELLAIADGTKTVAEVRADTAKRTADSKARLKASASSGQTEPDEAEAVEVVLTAERDQADEADEAPTPEEQWRSCLAHHTDGVFRLVAHWNENFGDDWYAFTSAEDINLLTRVVDEWNRIAGRILANLEKRLVDEARAPDIPASAAPAVEFDPGDIPEELRRTPAPADEDYQPPNFVKASFVAPAA